MGSIPWWGWLLIVIFVVMPLIYLAVGSYTVSQGIGAQNVNTTGKPA